MKKILAVSGGVDSMVLLSLFSNDDDAIVAHFDHGTRASSAEDREFVREAARRYDLSFITETAVLGEGVSEERARAVRYRFLRGVAEDCGGEIYTAHHLDDLVESVAINLLRGTGWRGLTPLYATDIKRPLLFKTRAEILQYAAENDIHFRQDPTNNEDSYLRNRVRAALTNFTEKETMAKLYKRQVEIRKEVEKIIDGLLPEDGHYTREWFYELDETVAVEILRAGLSRAKVAATRPQILDFLGAIKTYAPEKAFNLPGGKLVTIHKTYFVL